MRVFSKLIRIYERGLSEEDSLVFETTSPVEFYAFLHKQTNNLHPYVISILEQTDQLTGQEAYRYAQSLVRESLKEEN